MKFRPVGAEFHADSLVDRQTDLTKLIVTFHNFSNAPKTRVKDFSYPICRLVRTSLRQGYVFHL